VDEFGTAAGRREILGDRPQCGECQSSFLLGFAVCNLLRLFVLVDQAGDHFHQPRVGGAAHGAYAKLLDQHHFIALRVVGQHAHGVMPHEDLAVDHPAHAAVEFFVAQLHAIELVETLIGIVALNNLDRARRRFRDVRHILPRYARAIGAILTRSCPLAQPLYGCRDRRRASNSL